MKLYTYQISLTTCLFRHAVLIVFCSTKGSTLLKLPEFYKPGGHNVLLLFWQYEKDWLLHGLHLTDKMLSKLRESSFINRVLWQNSGQSKQLRRPLHPSICHYNQIHWPFTYQTFWRVSHARGAHADLMMITMARIQTLLRCSEADHFHQQHLSGQNVCRDYRLFQL